jgi:hypothetical protein
MPPTAAIGSPSMNDYTIAMLPKARPLSGSQYAIRYVVVVVQHGCATLQALLYPLLTTVLVPLFGAPRSCASNI